MEIFTAIILILCLLGLSWFAGTDAPYVATSMDKIPEVLKKAGVKKGKVFYELGSGDGRVVYAAAQMGADSFGIEQSWLRVLYSRFKARKLGLKNAHFSHGNIFQKNYSAADVVYAFLLQAAINKLELNFAKQLKSGAIVITQRYHFQKLKPFAQSGELNLYRF